MNTFSATDCIRAGWATFKKRGWFFVGISALMLVLSWLIGGLTGLMGDRDIGAFAGAVVNIALSTLLSMGFTAVMLRGNDSPESVEVSDMWHPKPFWKFLATQILVGLVVLVGLVLLIVPGIIATLALLFALYIVIDKDLGPIEAMRESARITRGSRWGLLLFVLIVVALNILGAAALFVGLLVTMPVTTLAIVHAYRTLEQKAKAAPVQPLQS